jgi:hypothetical protein
MTLLLWINPVDICLAILLGAVIILLSIFIFIMVQRREQALCMFINRYSATNCSNFAFGPNSSYHSDTIHIRLHDEATDMPTDPDNDEEEFSH